MVTSYQRSLLPHKSIQLLSIKQTQGSVEYLYIIFSLLIYPCQCWVWEDVQMIKLCFWTEIIIFMFIYDTPFEIIQNWTLSLELDLRQRDLLEYIGHEYLFKNSFLSICLLQIYSDICSCQICLYEYIRTFVGECVRV